MAETNHDGCEQECGCWDEGFADALAGMQEWSITVHDGTCRCQFCVTGIALIEAAWAIWPASYARSSAN